MKVFNTNRMPFEIDGWYYIGDLNLCYGGTFFKKADIERRLAGEVNHDVAAVEVVDMESMRGWENCFWIFEKLVTFNDRAIVSALNFVGLTQEALAAEEPLQQQLLLADALMSYGSTHTEQLTKLDPSRMRNLYEDESGDRAGLRKWVLNILARN